MLYFMQRSIHAVTFVGYEHVLIALFYDVILRHMLNVTVHNVFVANSGVMLRIMLRNIQYMLDTMTWS